jgi:hypothetical protein
MAHRSLSGSPETFSQPFYPLCPWIYGLFPATEFVVAPSSPLPSSNDPGATLARACLNFGDLTVTERSGAASRWSVPRSDFPLSDLDRTARTAGYHFAHARLTPWPACQRHPQPLILPYLISLRSILIERLGPPRTPLRPILIERLGPLQPSVSLWRWAHSVSALSPSVVDTPWPACQCSPAPPPPRAPSAVDLIPAVGFRSDG